MYRKEFPVHGLATLGLGLAIILATMRFGATAQFPMVSLVGDRIEECAREGVETPFGRLGCNPDNLPHNWTRSTARSITGVKFVSARSN